MLSHRINHTQQEEMRYIAACESEKWMAVAMDIKAFEDATKDKSPKALTKIPSLLSIHVASSKKLEVISDSKGNTTETETNTTATSVSVTHFMSPEAPRQSFREPTEAETRKLDAYEAIRRKYRASPPSPADAKLGGATEPREELQAEVDKLLNLDEIGSANVVQSSHVCVVL